MQGLQGVKVGDELFVVFKDEHRQDAPTREYRVRVEKIGRRWVECSREWSPNITANRYSAGRFDINTGKLDGYSYSANATAYRDEAQYRAMDKLRTDWVRFQRCVERQYLAPQALTQDIVDQLLALLEKAGLQP